MSPGRICILTAVLLLAVPNPSRLTAQNGKVEKLFPSENVKIGKDYNKKRYAPREKHLGIIIKNDGKNILFGNPCALMQTQRIRFEYVIQNPKLPKSVPGFSRRMNNFGVHLRLIFTRSPFWKLILNTKIKKCRQKSADLVGWLRPLPATSSK